MRPKDPALLPGESCQQQDVHAAEDRRGKKAKVLLGEKLFSFSQISSHSGLKHFHKL